MTEETDILNLETVNIAPLDNEEEKIEKKYFSRSQIISANKTERCIPSKIVLDDKNVSDGVVSESDQVKSEEDKSIVVEKYQEGVNKSKGKRRKKIKSDKVSKVKEKDLIRNIDSKVSKTCAVSKYDSELTSKATSVYTLLFDSRRLYDSCIYELRQKLFSLLKEDENTIFSLPYTSNQLYNVIKNTDAYINTTLDTYVKSYVIKQSIESWKSFIQSLRSFIKNPELFTGKPKIPKFLKSKHIIYNAITIDKSRFRYINYIDNTLILPNTLIKINVPKNINIDEIQQIKIVPYYNKVKIIYTFLDKSECIDNDYVSGRVLGGDLGVNNLVAITSNDLAYSALIKGGQIKTVNRDMNKKAAYYTSELNVCNKEQNTSKKIQDTYEKRNNTIETMMWNVAHQILDMMLETKSEIFVFGKNTGWKQEVNMGKKNNQNFVQIPYNSLIDKVDHLFSRYKNLRLIVVEESYTSIVDHLALETLEHHDNYLGKRVKRGLFESSSGATINADLNGAIGILRKANVISNAQLLNMRNRGDLVSPVVSNCLPYKKTKFSKNPNGLAYKARFGK